MAKFPFIDKYGHLFYHETDNVEEGQKTYIIIKKESDIICMRDKDALMYKLPLQSDLELNIEPTGEYNVLSYVIRHDKPLKELQSYLVYEVGYADLKNIPLEWVKLSDILLDSVTFDATQKNGIKNLVVRGK